MKSKQPLFYIIDLFCGFGGTTLGYEMAQLEGTGIAEVIACVNHDPKAIKSHWLNHPDVKHFEEDIRTLDLTELIALVNHCRVKNPEAKIILWASLECTNFSNAKGGKPRDADSRTLANHLDRYVIALGPDYIKIENVVEFRSWGPLDENGKPVCRKKGEDWMKWRELICSHGYVDDWKEMNAANYGAYTSRNRLFGVFARPWLPIVWPNPTHAKFPEKFSMYGDLKKWKAVKDVLDFKDEGESIFTRKKPLSDKTLERIFAGLVKFVAKGDTAFISKYFSGRPAGKVNSVNDPGPTITTFSGHTLVQPEFLLKYNSTNGKTGKHNPPSLEEPSPVVSCQGRLGLVQTEFLAAHYSSGQNVSSVESPCPTISTKDRFQFIRPEYFIDKTYTGNKNIQSIESPAGTILTNDKHRLVETVPFVMPTNYNNQPTSIEDPSPTITANRKWHYLINPSWYGNAGSVEHPCCVIVARQDKAPLYFVHVESGSFSIGVYEDDSEPMIRIKQFMAVYGIVDIKMRMLRVKELLKIQGFPENYQMMGNQTDHKKFIGNSVVPHVPKAWCEAMGKRLIEENLQVA